MRYQVNFGNLSVASSPAKPATGKFRLAVLGDFSARASSGQLDTGEQLAKRKPLRVDADNLEEILQRFNVVLRLPIASDGLRLVHGEADGLPGLIVDRYGDVLILQSLTAGSELWKETVAELLLEETGLTTIFERSDADVRELEGLQPQVGLLRGVLL